MPCPRIQAEVIMLILLCILIAVLIVGLYFNILVSGRNKGDIDQLKRDQAGHLRRLKMLETENKILTLEEIKEINRKVTGYQPEKSINPADPPEEEFGKLNEEKGLKPVTNPPPMPEIKPPKSEDPPGPEKKCNRASYLRCLKMLEDHTGE
jgi:hypothetical protein